jgi:phycocyanobilin lyase beta subunit
LLLETAKNDFALSVRRAAAKGLGSIRWEKMAPGQIAPAQQQCTEVLLGLCDDPEWVVRYAAISALESLGQVEILRSGICQRLQQVFAEDGDVGVRSRAQLAIQRLTQ